MNHIHTYIHLKQSSLNISTLVVVTESLRTTAFNGGKINENNSILYSWRTTIYIVNVPYGDRMNKIDIGLECTLKNCNIENLDHPYIPDKTLLKNTLSNTLNNIERYKGNVLFVVNCTRKKVFPNIKRYKNNKRDNCDRGYTPAGCVYCGSSFIKFKIFLEKLKKKMKEKDIDYPILDHFKC